MVANLIRTNGRDLDGAVNRLLAHTTLAGSVLSMEQAENAIRDLIRHREAKRIKIEDIQKLVATHFNVSRADILSSRRTANVVKPRQIAMYLAKILTPRSLPEIGRRFGDAITQRSCTPCVKLMVWSPRTMRSSGNWIS